MTLLEHWKSTGLTLKEYALKLGYAPGRVLGWTRQRRRPDLQTAHRLELATDGEVRPIDWLEPELRARVLRARGVKD